MTEGASDAITSSGGGSNGEQQKQQEPKGGGYMGEQQGVAGWTCKRGAWCCTRAMLCMPELPIVVCHAYRILPARL